MGIFVFSFSVTLTEFSLITRCHPRFKFHEHSCARPDFPTGLLVLGHY